MDKRFKPRRPNNTNIPKKSYSKRVSAIHQNHSPVTEQSIISFIFPFSPSQYFVDPADNNGYLQLLPWNNKNARLYRASGIRERNLGSAHKGCLHILPFFHPVGRIAIGTFATRTAAESLGTDGEKARGETGRGGLLCSGGCPLLFPFLFFSRRLIQYRPGVHQAWGPVAKVLSGAVASSAAVASP